MSSFLAGVFNDLSFLSVSYFHCEHALTSPSFLQPLENQLWFFPNVSRVQADEMFAEHGMRVGMFMVRSSSSGPGAYALSFVNNNGEPLHVLINFDAITRKYMLDGHPVADGISDIIASSSDPSTCMLPVVLTDPVPRFAGMTAPPQSNVVSSTPSHVQLAAPLETQEELKNLVMSDAFKGVWQAI